MHNDCKSEKKEGTYPRQTVLSWLQRQNQGGPKNKAKTEKRVNDKITLSKAVWLVHIARTKAKLYNIYSHSYFIHNINIKKLFEQKLLYLLKNTLEFKEHGLNTDDVLRHVLVSPSVHPETSFVPGIDAGWLHLKIN